MAKKANQEGSIRRRSNGTWEGSVRITDMNGVESRPYFYGKTQAAVRKQINAAVNKADHGIYIASDDLIMYDWLIEWLWSIKKEQVKPKTFGWYEELIRNHIQDTALAKMKVVDIRRNHIQNWVKQDMKKNGSARAVNAAYGVIRNSMNDAIRLGIIIYSYADKVVLPKQKPAPIKILTVKQQKLFMDAIQNHRLRSAFFLTLTTGLREGEIAALRWIDIDFDEMCLVIKRDAIRVNIYDENTHKKIGSEIIIQDSPKSAAGYRTIPLLPAVVNELRRHRLKQNEEKMKNRKLWQDNGLCFCNEIGQIYDPKTFYTTIRKICDKTDGLEKIKFHALRHTFATRALESDINQKTVQDLLGHETPDMTMHYTHILEEHKKKEIQKLQDVFPAPKPF